MIAIPTAVRGPATDLRLAFGAAAAWLAVAMCAGRATGVVYEGLTQVTLGIDLERLVQLPGATVNISAFQIHGRGLSTNNIGNLNVVSSIEADRATRLFEAWYQQVLFNGAADIKIGQQSADLEFMTSQYSALFVNTMFGWPGVPSYDMPSGGPAYPLADLGVRVRGQITPSLTALAGVFDADPLGNNPDNLSGTNFNLHNGALFIGELQYAINQPADGEMVGMNQTGLPGTYKVGVWYNSVEETLANLGLPPNRKEGEPGFLTWETNGRKGLAASASDSHPMSYCLVPPSAVEAMAAAKK